MDAIQGFRLNPQKLQSVQQTGKGARAGQTQTAEASNDIQAYLANAYQNLAAQNNPALTNQNQVQQASGSQAVSGIEGSSATSQRPQGVSLGDLQGRMQLSPQASMQQSGMQVAASEEGGDKQTSDLLKQVTASVNAASEQATAASANKMPDVAIGKLKDGFDMVAGAQQSVGAANKQGKQKLQVGQVQSPAERKLQAMMNRLTQQAAGIMQGQGVNVQPQDVKSLWMDSFNKKSGQQNGQAAPTNQGMVTKQRLEQTAQTLMSGAESNPWQANSNIQTVKAIQALLDDSSTSAGLDARMQNIQPQNVQAQSGVQNQQALKTKSAVQSV